MQHEAAALLEYGVLYGAREQPVDPAEELRVGPRPDSFRVLVDWGRVGVPALRRAQQGSLAVHEHAP